MASPTEETNPLDQLRALRTEVIDRERSRMRGVLGEATAHPGPESEPGPVAADTVPAPVGEADATPDRKPRKGRGGRKVAALEGEELKIRLDVDLRRLIARQCHADGWSIADLVSSVLRQALSARSPEIRHGGVSIASADVCRFWQRHPMETALRLTSDKGVFLVTTNPASPLFSHWKEHYTILGWPEADRMARQMRLIQLQEWVQSAEDFEAEGWCKAIAEEDYHVIRAVVAQHDAPTESAAGDDEPAASAANP